MNIHSISFEEFRAIERACVQDLVDSSIILPKAERFGLSVPPTEVLPLSAKPQVGKFLVLNQRVWNSETNTDQFTLTKSRFRFNETLNIHVRLFISVVLKKLHGFNYLFMYSSYNMKYLTFCQDW